jgi:hypothetical protein
MIIGDVIAHQSMQMGIVVDDHVIEKLSAVAFASVCILLLINC